MIKYLKNKIKIFKVKCVYRMDVSGKHQTGLFKIYKSYFKPLKYKKIKLLEIGVEHGGSVLSWSDYFKHPAMTITGLDIKLPPIKFPRRVTVYKCDQNDIEGLKAIADKHGPFDIIVDDGSHELKETENCFSTLWKYVNPDGYYVIEDWSMGYIGMQFAGMSEYIAGIIKDAIGYNISELWVHWDKKSAAAIFRKKGSNRKLYPHYIKGFIQKYILIRRR